MRKKCLQCGKEFEKPSNESMKNWLNRHKFCCRVCHDLFQIGKKHTEECKKKISLALKGNTHGFKKGCISWIKGVKGVHFSPATEFKKGLIPHNKGIRKSTNTGRTWFQKGYKTVSPFYKGMIPWNKGLISGKTSELKLLRNSFEFKKWRNIVFERDDYTCQYCNKKGGYLHPHHIYSFSNFPDLRFSLFNGITLCADCHNKFHKKYGMRNNISLQFFKFLVQA